VFHHLGVNCVDAVAIGLNLGDVKIVERVVSEVEYDFNHIAGVGVHFYNGGSKDFNGFGKGLLGLGGIDGRGNDR
jgi:hypothetical protein